MTMRYTVTVTDWTEPRGYPGSGRGWRVRCFGLPDGNWNATGSTVYEAYHPSKEDAVAKARELATTHSATFDEGDL